MSAGGLGFQNQQNSYPYRHQARSRCVVVKLDGIWILVWQDAMSGVA